ncbi:MAG TPA: hypothetical protein VLF71_03995 [Candidatus Saccharimonadales bacterium]|nr:hypothetical protein [Candidatus Saccharimonadales bacterium]
MNSPLPYEGMRTAIVRAGAFLVDTFGNDERPLPDYYSHAAAYLGALLNLLDKIEAGSPDVPITTLGAMDYSVRTGMQREYDRTPRVDPAGVVTGLNMGHYALVYGFLEMQDLARTHHYLVA